MKRLFTIALFSIFAVTLTAATIQDGDGWWAKRAEGATGAVAALEPIDHAIAAYREVLGKAPSSVEARWKLMRALYFRGRYTGRSEAQQQDIYGEMIRIGEEGFKQLGLEPKSKESKFVEKIRGDQNAAYLLFYQAVGWGQWALVYGKMKAVRKGAAGKIRRYSRACMAAWPKMEEGGPERVLGRLHHQTPRVPFITGWASNKKAMLYLRKAVEIGPENTLNQLFLAELLLDEKGKAEAKEIFQRLASMTPRPDHLVEDADAALAAKKHLEE